MSDPTGSRCRKYLDPVVGILDIPTAG
ncbi:unnamed protein product, partial [Adineta ricciae]